MCAAVSSSFPSVAVLFVSSSRSYLSFFLVCVLASIGNFGLGVKEEGSWGSTTCPLIFAHFHIIISRATRARSRFCAKRQLSSSGIGDVSHPNHTLERS